MTRPQWARFGAAASLCLWVMGCSDTPVDTAAECWGEVEAAYQRLERQSYRAETTSIRDRQTGRRTVEFVPPDRTRLIVGTGGLDTELIKVGNRLWLREHTEWREWSDQLRGAPFALLLKVRPDETTFACLGSVEFSGRTYTGYRTRDSLKRVVVTVVSPDKPRKAQSELPQLPPVWRTVLVDRHTGLLEYEIVAPENQIDNPESRTHYSYPKDMVIEPPAR